MLYTGSLQHGKDYYPRLLKVLDLWFESTRNKMSQLLSKLLVMVTTPLLTVPERILITMLSTSWHFRMLSRLQPWLGMYLMPHAGRIGKSL
jgi:hypothetical protein